MRVPRIYTPQPLHEALTIQLEEGPSHHLAKVLRMQEGRELLLFNGDGAVYSALITQVGKKAVTVTLREKQNIDRESLLDIELAIGISRGERFDWVLQKATELGVTRIVPLITERTEVKISGDRLDKIRDRWQQILISSCEQCQRNRLPQLSDPVALPNWLEAVTSDVRFVLHHRDTQSLPQAARPASVSLLIGPEGGLSDGEIVLAKQAGFDALTLGPRVLRTETAPIAAITLVQYLWGDLA